MLTGMQENFTIALKAIAVGLVCGAAHWAIFRNIEPAALNALMCTGIFIFVRKFSHA
jgi:hypothetical protein